MTPTKPCDNCDGTGTVEACTRHWSNNCPCWRTTVECGECDGRGEVPLSDEEIEALEGGSDNTDSVL